MVSLQPFPTRLMPCCLSTPAPFPIRSQLSLETTFPDSMDFRILLPLCHCISIFSITIFVERIPFFFYKNTGMDRWFPPLSLPFRRNHRNILPLPLQFMDRGIKPMDKIFSTKTHRPRRLFPTSSAPFLSAMCHLSSGKLFHRWRFFLYRILLE